MLNDWTRPLSSMTIIASGTVSRIERRCASRPIRSPATSSASLRERRSHSPTADTPVPTRAMAMALTMSSCGAPGVSVVGM
jgi:hypothetical protein